MLGASMMQFCSVSLRTLWALGLMGPGEISRPQRSLAA